jgi:hypothetical protein
VLAGISAESGLGELVGGPPPPDTAKSERHYVPEDCPDICQIGRGCFERTSLAIPDCDTFCDGRTDPFPRYGCMALHHEDCEKTVACSREPPRKAPPSKKR